MSLEYPRNVVWYLEARKWGWPQTEPQMGSAVVVWLKSRGSPPRLRKFLLTCAHVIREGTSGYGPLLREVLCWHPGRGYTKPLDIPDRVSGKSPGAFVAKVFSLDPFNPPADEVPEEERRPELDWMLLDVQEASFQSVEPVRDWAEPADDEPLDIIGYPGGAAAWEETRVVENVKSEDFHGQRLATPGTLRLGGSAPTAAGMSGGGVFNKRGQLVGIHRSQTAAQLEFGAVRAATIRDVLAANGWDIVQLSLPEPVVVPRGGVPATPADAALAMEAELEITASAVEFDDQDNLRSRRPIEGLTVALEPKGFSPVEPARAQTDQEGVAVLKVKAPPGTPESSLTGHLVCESPPPQLAEVAPLVTSVAAAVKKGEQVTTFGRPLRLSRRTALEVDVVPYSKLQRYYIVEFPILLDRALAARAAPVDDTDSVARKVDLTAAIEGMGRDLELDGDTLKKAQATWLDQLRAERPALGAGEPLVWQGRDLEDTLSTILPSVHALVMDAGVLLGTGFVIAKDTVMAFGPAVEGRVTGVRPGEASGASEPVWKIGEVLWRDDALNVAILAVPGVEGEPLPLCGRAPFVEPADREVAVIGYPVRDARLPAELNQVMFEQKFGVKRVMPGQLLPPDPRRGGGGGDRLRHDATTAGGASGGPLIDLVTGAVIGVHEGGMWAGARKDNTAVPMWRLLGVPEVREILERRGARVVHPPVSEGPRPRAPHLEKTAPYAPDFLPGVLVPLPRLAAGAIATGDLRRGRVLDYVHLSIVMDEHRPVARFVAANVDRSLMLRIPRGREEFLLDPRVPAKQQGDASLYAGNAWDRGHLARPSALAWGRLKEAQSAHRAAYYYTNIAPQHAQFNQGLWLLLEEHVFRGLHPESSKLCFFAGPVLAEDDLRYRGVKVPRRFWMLAVYENPEGAGAPLVHAFVAAQYAAGAGGDIEPIARPPRDASLAEYEVSVDELEEVTGLRFDLPGRTR